MQLYDSNIVSKYSKEYRKLNHPPAALPQEEIFSERHSTKQDFIEIIRTLDSASFSYSEVNELIQDKNQQNNIPALKWWLHQFKAGSTIVAAMNSCKKTNIVWPIRLRHISHSTVSSSHHLFCLNGDLPEGCVSQYIPQCERSAIAWKENLIANPSSIIVEPLRHVPKCITDIIKIMRETQNVDVPMSSQTHPNIIYTVKSQSYDNYAKNIYISELDSSTEHAMNSLDVLIADNPSGDNRKSVVTMDDSPNVKVCNITISL
jgi:hypothetical protein